MIFFDQAVATRFKYPLPICVYFEETVIYYNPAEMDLEAIV